MDTNPAIEQFIKNCIKGRTAALKLIVESRKDYRQRYYHKDCLWDSRRGVVERSEQEKIEEICPFEDGFAVTATKPYPEKRSRYRVGKSGEGWMIQEVDRECIHCHVFEAFSSCPDCGGTGWQIWKWREELVRYPVSPNLENESRGDFISEASIEQFMNAHFQERTIVLTKEREIMAEYFKRYFAPKLDWSRWLVSAERSKAEKIEKIIPTDSGAYVITSGFHPWLLRYNLLKEGEKWLISKVDMECANCNAHGKRADCPLCGGKLWQRKRIPPGNSSGSTDKRFDF